MKVNCLVLLLMVLTSVTAYPQSKGIKIVQQGQEVIAEGTRVLVEINNTTRKAIEVKIVNSSSKLTVVSDCNVIHAKSIGYWVLTIPTEFLVIYDYKTGIKLLEYKKLKKEGNKK